MENNIFNYNGTDITFLSGNGDVLVNATQLAKPYGKRPNDYLNLPSTKQLIKAITRKYGSDESQLVRTINGGTNPGTWMHRLIVIDYCQWLNIDLKLWCTEKIDELMRYGMTATEPTLEAMVDNPDLIIQLATKLKEERAEKERAILANKQLEADKIKIIEETKPCVVFTESVKVSNTNILVRDLAKIITQNGIPIGAQRLYDWFVEKKYLIRHKRWSKSRNKYVTYYTPTQVSSERDLFWVSERPISNPGETPFTVFTTYVTGKGQIYFVNKFLSNKESA